MSDRQAYVCEKCFKEDGVRERHFRQPGEVVPTCRTHGRMDLQPNQPYKRKELLAEARAVMKRHAKESQ